MAQWFTQGMGSAADYRLFLEQNAVRKPLVVTGLRFQGLLHGLYQAGLYQAGLSQAGLQAVYFSGYHPNPDLGDAQKGAAVFNQESCDCLISIGGGSAMDTAKAIKYTLGLKGLPHLAIPTTAGTGSEATRFAVVYVAGEKQSLDVDWLLPDGVILDGGLLKGLPPYHQKACLMDALCQGIESYWAQAATAQSRAFAQKAITGVLNHYKAYLKGDETAAQAVLTAAYHSGRAIEYTRTTAPHAMSYKLTTLYGIAHGHAVALTLPYVWEAMETADDLRATLDDLNRLMNAHGPEMVKQLLLELGLEAPIIRSFDELDLLCQSVNTQRLSNHPVPLTPDMLKGIYQKALHVPTQA